MRKISFLHYINDRHPHINAELLFLAVLIKHHEEVITSIYHKDSYTGLLTNCRGFGPRVDKRMLHSGQE